MEFPSPSTIERRWWTADKGKVHPGLWGLVDFLRHQQRERRRMNRLHMRIVASDDPAGRGWFGTPMDMASSRMEGGNDKTRYLLCLSIVDTACSIISSAKPTLQYLTQDGDWELQRKAKRRTDALSGQMRELKIEELGPKAFRTACITDVGSLIGYLHPETRKPTLAWVPSNETLIDHNEAIHGEPRNRYRVYPANRERMKELYPKFAKQIETAFGISQKDREDFYLSKEAAIDSVMVVESWHLGPSRKDGRSPKGGAGRHMIIVSNCDLIDEEYKHQKFPFADVVYSDQPIGWYGQSLVSRTKEAQRRCNQIIRKYERCQDLLSKAMCVIPRSSGLTPEQITNMPGEVVMSESGEPQLLVWNGTPPDLRQELPAIREETLNNEGLSEQQVAGAMMEGVRSAVGIRAADDVQNRRHVHPQRRYERFHLDVAELLSRLNDDATEEDPSYSITSQVKRGRRDYIHSFPWKEVQLDEGDARLGIFPTSSLSSTPKGRRDDVMGLLQANLIDQNTALELLDLPDIDTETARQLAEIDYCRCLVEDVMDDNNAFIDPVLGPEGRQLLLDTARKSYLQLLCSRAPEEVLQRMRDFMKDVDAEIERLDAPPPQDQPPQGAPTEAPMNAGPAAPGPMPNQPMMAAGQVGIA